MSEYIDREWLLSLYDESELTEEEKSYGVPFKCVRQNILDAPAADVAPVTRCKDCIHYEMGTCLKIYSDGSVHSAAWQERKPDDFCSYGEPKEKTNADDHD